MPDIQDLSKELISIGRLMGILQGDQASPSFEQKWFGSPLFYLETAGHRLDCVVDLLTDILPTAVADAPDVFPGAGWFPLPNPKSGTNTPFYIVMPAPTTAAAKDTLDDAGTGGQIGLGFLHTFQASGLKIEAFIYVPLFSYDLTGAKFIADSTDPANACQVGLYCTAGETFKVDAVSFTALKFDANIFLAAQSPTLTVTFEGLTGTTAPTTYTTLQSLIAKDPPVGSWIGEVVLKGQSWLQLKPGGSSSVGDILTAAGFLSNDNGQYNLSLANLTGDASEIALNFVFAALNALANLATPLVDLPGGGVFVSYRDNADNSRDYGVRFVADLPLTTQPKVDLCLGTWLGGETDTANWIQAIDKQVESGLILYLLNHTNTSNTFAPGFGLNSVGVDIKGGGDAPLIDINGYTLNGAEVRSFLDSSDWTYGFALYLDDIGFPLGPDFGAGQGNGSSSNPVAANLLASGGQSGTGGKTAVNPGFSAKTAYISGKSPLFAIIDLQGNQTDLVWFPVQRRLGPLNCEKIGVKVDATGDNAADPLLSLIFDGGVSLGGLDVELDQLSLDTHLKEVADTSSYSLDLQGMAVTFSAGGVEVSGGFTKTTQPDSSIAYDGEALLKYQDLTIAAIGSYASLNTPSGGATSLFIFAVLNYPIGGPAFFYVTGLMAGFGYNRSLQIPTADTVQTFPLLAGLVDSSKIGGSNPTPAGALSKLDTWVPPELGEYWLAAGVQFSTFEIINTNALLIIEFGKEFVVSVLGVSTLKQPQVGTSYVYAELDIAAVFSPSQGEFSVSAVLAPNSYVFTPDAHLTGGFAFYSWFGDNANAGDFVFTIGGYNPGFPVPAHYPQEPRLGINWQISDNLAMTGDAYFAITPSAMMAGGGLQITFSDGPLNAWLKAQADIILCWKPFYLIADVSVSVGVSFRLHVLFVDVTLSVEIGAEFHLWGPPIGGTVHIDWYIISFTIGFGLDIKGPDPLSWHDFKGLLPAKPPVGPSDASQITFDQTSTSSLFGAAAASDLPSTPAYLNINANTGLKTAKTVDGTMMWLVRAGQFQFSVGSALPATSIIVTGNDGKGNPANVTLPGTSVGVSQVNGGIKPGDYQSVQTVTILRVDTSGVTNEIAAIQACRATTSSCTNQSPTCQAAPIDIKDWAIDQVSAALPAAMWIAPTSTREEDADTGPAPVTVACTTGVTMSPATPALNGSPSMVIDDIFRDRIVNAGDTFRLPLSETQLPDGNSPMVADSFADIRGTNDLARIQKRGDLFLALQALGLNGWTNDPLTMMAADPGKDFADEPMEGGPVTPGF